MADSPLQLYLKNLNAAQPGDVGKNPLSDLNQPSGMKEIGLIRLILRSYLSPGKAMQYRT